MLSYILKCRTSIESKNSKFIETKNGSIIPLSKYAVRDCKKLKFFKDSEAIRLLSSSGVKTPLSKIPLVRLLLFWRPLQVNTRYKMNEVVNKFLLVGINLCLKCI